MNEKIKDIVKAAIDELNEQMDEEGKLTYSEDLRLTGRDAAMDSMSFVTFVTIVEELISDELEKNIHIVSDRAFSAQHSPFKNIESFEAFIAELVDET